MLPPSTARPLMAQPPPPLLTQCSAASSNSSDEEQALLRDVLYGFAGVESDCFRLDPSGTTFHYHRRGSPALSPCLCCACDEVEASSAAAERRGLRLGSMDSVVVERVLAPLNAAWRVSRFCDAEAHASSLTVMSFASALHSLVLEHVALFAAKLHALLLKDQLSLSKLLLYIELHVAKRLAIACMLIEVFGEQRTRRAALVATAGESAVAATALLDTFDSKKVRNFVDAVRDEQATELHATARSTAIQTYVQCFALQWMTHGTLTNDVFHEFFIRPCSSPAKEGSDGTAAAAQADDEDGLDGALVPAAACDADEYRFEISEPKVVPKFVRKSGLQAAVFDTGMYVCLANRGSAVANYTTPRAGERQPFGELVAECATLANRLLLDAVCHGDQHSLVATFRRLTDQHFFLGAQRDVLSRFVEHFFADLCAEAAPFAASPEREHKENRLFREYLKQWCPSGATIECCCCGESGSTAASKEGALLVETLRATVRVPKEYEVLVSDESVRTYRTLSTSLLMLRFVEEQFVHRAYQAFVHSTAPFVGSQFAKEFCVVLFEMRTFVARFEQFFYETVVRPGLDRFIAGASSMLAGGSIDIKALRAMHDAFVRDCAAGSTLDDPRCREFLVLILRTVMEYCQLLQAVRPSVEDEDPLRQLDDTLSRLIDTRDALRKQLDELLGGWLQHVAISRANTTDERFTTAFGDLLAAQ